MEVIDLCDSEDDAADNLNDVEEVQVERTVRDAAPAGGNDDEDLVVTGALKPRTPHAFVRQPPPRPSHSVDVVRAR